MESYVSLSGSFSFLRRDVRAAEGARLESVYMVNSRIVGSNPTPSAIFFKSLYQQARSEVIDFPCSFFSIPVRKTL